MEVCKMLQIGNQAIIIDFRPGIRVRGRARTQGQGGKGRRREGEGRTNERKKVRRGRSMKGKAAKNGKERVKEGREGRTGGSERKREGPLRWRAPFSISLPAASRWCPPFLHTLRLQLRTFSIFLCAHLPWGLLLVSVSLTQ